MDQCRSLLASDPGMEADTVQDMDAAASFHKPVSFPEVVGVVRRLCAAR